MSHNIMRTRIYLMSFIFLLVLLLTMVTRQFMVDFYWKMANQDGKALNKTIGELGKCIAIDNNNALFHFSLGRTYLRKGLGKAAKQSEKNRWVRKAIDEFHKAIKLKPSDSDYHFHFGISYGCLGYPPPFYWEVIQNSLNRTVMLHPTNALHLYSIGIYYFNEYHRLKNIGRTIEEIGPANNKNYLAMSKANYELCFRKLVGVNEEYLGEVLEKCFSVTQKYADLKVVIGDTARSHSSLARFLKGKGMWEDAKIEYMMAINLEPFNPFYYSDFANALSRRGDFENAITWWQKQKMVNPQDEKIYLSLSHGFMRLNRFDDALRELHELIKLNPENINYRVKLIRILLAAHRLDEAIDEYYKVLEKHQNFSKSMYDTIRYYQRKGNYRKATSMLNEAISSVLNK